MKNLMKRSFAIMTSVFTMVIMVSCDFSQIDANKTETLKSVELNSGTRFLVRLDPVGNSGRSLTGGETEAQYGIFSIKHVSETSLDFDLTMLNANGQLLDTTSHSLDRLDQPLNIDGDALPVYAETLNTSSLNNAYKLSLLKELDGGISDWKVGSMDTLPDASEDCAGNDVITDWKNGGNIESLYDFIFIIIICIIAMS